MKKSVLFFFALFNLAIIYAQNTQDAMSRLLDSITNADKKSPEYVIATFKSTHLINQQTVETPGKRSLDFRISHHFGDLSSGANNAWGIDGPAVIRLGLDYSFDGRLMIGAGRSSYQKMADGTLKYKLLRQQTNAMPLTLTAVSTIYYNATLTPDLNGYNKYHYWADRLSFSHQLIVGRKFSDNFSGQLAPIYIHYNIVDHISDKNDMWALQVAVRYKLSRRFALSAEGSYVFNSYSRQTYYSPIGLGCEIETGGHVFQVFLTNSSGMAENQFIPYTQSSWKDFGVKLGFNISRVFSL
ncbi:MAG: hypothetical protein JNL63_06765 [Bacteroidia bacterium]|nr:hypothetical protein [Bacteroidia bacterium]